MLGGCSLYLNKKIFELSEKITSQIQQGRSFILHTGTPIEAERAYSEHAKDSNHLKIIVINGGLAHGMQDINSDYVEQDTGFGGMWKCRETINIELDTSFLEFLKHYIYKVLFLPYLPSNDADGWRTMEVMKDVYFKYENFLEYCKELTYKPVINDNSPSFPSQVFGNCVTYNLFHAIKFANHLYCQSPYGDNFIKNADFCCLQDNQYGTCEMIITAILATSIIGICYYCYNDGN